MTALPSPSQVLQRIKGWAHPLLQSSQGRQGVKAGFPPLPPCFAIERARSSGQHPSSLRRGKAKMGSLLFPPSLQGVEREQGIASSSLSLQRGGEAAHADHLLRAWLRDSSFLRTTRKERKQGITSSHLHHARGTGKNVGEPSSFPSLQCEKQARGMREQESGTACTPPP